MINIAIDGPSGAGKSTIAKSIAARKKITYLDTGAMYRAVGLKVYLTNSDMYDENQLSNILDNLDLDIKYVNGEQKVFLDGKDVSKDIREHHISKLASDVSAIPACRLKLVDLQRRIAEKSDCVLDGRDIGTYVLPDANVKIFLTASPEVRATRRYKELLAKAFKVEPMAMYKAELRENKFLRGFLDSINAIPVHRGEGDLNAIKTALTGLKNGKSLLIAPEATRNKNYDGSLLPFKVGAVSLSIKTKTPIRPIYIYHPRNKKGKIKGRTLIFVGEILDLSQFYGQQQTKELLSQANERLFEEFCKLKESCQKYLADKKAKKSKR